MKTIATLLLVLTSFLCISQTTGVVIDSYTKEPLPFVNILIDGGPEGAITNIDGKFSIHNSFTSLHFTFIGYQDQFVKKEELTDTIYLSSSNNLLGSIEIQPGINPAHRIIRLASRRRKENRPEGNINFKIESYNKFILTGNMDSLLKAQEKDTNNIKLLKTLENQHLFLLESVSETDHHKATGSRKKVIASKTSGLKSPLFAAFFAQAQSFSFYENTMDFGEKSFISPLAPGGTRRYIYILQDSIMNGDSFTYIIRYLPKSKKNFDGLKGTLYINSENYALEKIAATTDEPIEGATISVLQNFKKVGSYWFPFELYIDVSIQNILSKNTLKGIGKSYIRDLELNPKIKFGNNGFSMEVAEGASEKDENYWIDKRLDTITIKEEETYRVVDSISQANKIEKRFEILKSILKGKIPIGFIDVDLLKIEGYNPFEGFMLGLDLHTNNKLSKTVQFGGFFRYAFKDKKFKYGGDITFNLYRKRKVFLNIDFREDAVVRGGMHQIQKKDIFESSAGFNKYFVRSKEYVRKIEATIGGYARGNVETHLFTNYQRRYYFDDYRYITKNDFEASDSKYDLFEVGLRARWTIREKVIQSEGDIISLGSKYPTFQLSYTQGIRGVINSKYSYSNIQLQINQDFKIRGVGKLMIQLNGVATFGRVPLSMLHFANGSNEKVGISVQNTFETMYSGEYLSDKSASLFLTMAFNEIKTGSKWTAPQFSLSTAIGIGSLSNKNHHQGYTFTTMEKGYYESGLIVNNILTLGVLGIGGGVFYKYGPYADVHEKNNFAYKIAIKFNI
jgi:hypothetical protein